MRFCLVIIKVLTEPVPSHTFAVNGHLMGIYFELYQTQNNTVYTNFVRPLIVLYISVDVFTFVVGYTLCKRASKRSTRVCPLYCCTFFCVNSWI